MCQKWQKLGLWNFAELYFHGDATLVPTINSIAVVISELLHIYIKKHTQLADPKSKSKNFIPLLTITSAWSSSFEGLTPANSNTMSCHPNGVKVFHSLELLTLNKKSKKGTYFITVSMHILTFLL